MKRDEILKNARDYVRNEENAFFRREIEALIKENNHAELKERFSVRLAFGTGGLRGIIGGGYNRMNPLTVKCATQGLCNYIIKKGGSREPCVVIAYDSRHYSDLFALEAARVLCANGIKTYIYSTLRSTPQLSFSVRALKAIAGIVITASHNPPNYNGYKVYWKDGAQIVAPHDQGIIAEVEALTDTPRTITRQAAEEQGQLLWIDKRLDEAFIAMVASQALRPALVKRHGRDLKVVYTPLHGAGAVAVEQALNAIGVGIIFVPQQKAPDGHFPTVERPNPEEIAAMQMALESAARHDADLILGTDPDVDRLGVGARSGEGYRLLNGNQIGVLLADYLFTTQSELGTLPDRPAFVNTIVTTNLQCLIAEAYGCQCYETLTGFKYIGEKIHQFETTEKGPQFVFGAEESYGYLVETESRDKNAISAAVILAEMTLFYMRKGQTLFDRLDIIYERYGYFQERLISRYFEGLSGKEAITDFMQSLRRNTPSVFGGRAVRQIKDFQNGSTTDLRSGQKTANIDLPLSNVLQLVLEDDSIITVRPSGTEPKIKFYASCRASQSQPLDEAKPAVAEKLASIEKEINIIMDRCALS